MSHIRFVPMQVPIAKAFTGAATLALLGVLAVGVSGASAQAGGFVPTGDDDAYFGNAPPSISGGEVVCMVSGAAGVAGGPVDGVMHDGADDDESFTNPPVAFNDTDGGEFGFATVGVPEPALVSCAGSDGGGEVIGQLAATDLAINAGITSRQMEGEYTNLLLGTGHAEGTADLCGPGAFNGATLACETGMGAGNETNLVTRFSVDFVDARGPLAITSFDGVVDLTAANSITPPITGQDDPDDPGGIDHLQDIDTGHGVGVVQITPGAMPAATANPDCNTDPPNANPPDGDHGAGGPGTPPPGNDVGGFQVEAMFTATLSGDADFANNENDDPKDAPDAC